MDDRRPHDVSVATRSTLVTAIDASVAEGLINPADAQAIRLTVFGATHSGDFTTGFVPEASPAR
jgi:hypothetical protein